MNTLVYHDGGLGDTLLSLPSIRKLRSNGGRIHLAGRGDVVRFLKEADAVDEAFSSDQALFASLYTAIDDRLRTFLSSYDRVWVFTTGAQTSAAAAIRSIVPLTRIITTLPPVGTSLHAAAFRFLQLDSDAHVEEDDPFLTVPREKKKKAFSMLRDSGCEQGGPLIAVHPGSGGRIKCWPLERYFEVIERLESEHDVFAIIFTGEAEDESVRNAVDAFVRNRRNRLHAADLDLMTCAALLSHCRSYLGNDSGFSHLAGVMGCPSVVLFGPTDPALWKPLRRSVTVIATSAFAPMTEITTDEVIRSIAAASFLVAV